jgi:hypothetical protein
MLIAPVRLKLLAAQVWSASQTEDELDHRTVSNLPPRVGASTLPTISAGRIRCARVHVRCWRRRRRDATCLVVLVLAPIVTVVAAEVVGHRHVAEAVERIRH